MEHLRSQTDRILYDYGLLDRVKKQKKTGEKHFAARPSAEFGIKRSFFTNF